MKTEDKIIKYNNIINAKYYKSIDLTNRVNCYTCEKCKKITKTRDIDKGTIPYMHKCFYCGGMAFSSYFRDIAPDQEPVEEWYRPDFKELIKMSEANQEYVLQGGLLPRKIIKKKGK